MNINKQIKSLVMVSAGDQETLTNVNDSKSLTPTLIPEEILSLEGKEAIFYERGRIFHISISNVREYGRGFLAKATPIKTHGLLFPKALFSFGCAWEYLSLKPHQVSTFGYINWDVFTDPEIIAQVIAIASEIPAGQTYAEDFMLLPPHANGARKKVYGPISKRLHELLRYGPMI